MSATSRNSEVLLQRAERLSSQAVSLYMDGRYAEAAVLAEEALVIRERIRGPYHPDVAVSLSNLGELLRAQGDYETARTHFERAVAIQDTSLGPDHPDLAPSLVNLAGLYHDLSMLQEAVPLYSRAISIYQEYAEPGHADLALCMANLASLLHDMGDLDTAHILFEEALAIHEQTLGPNHLDVGRALMGLASLLESKGDIAEARPLLERAAAILETALGADHPDLATVLNNLGDLLQSLGDLAAARLLHERTLSIRTTALDPEHPLVSVSANNLASVMRAQGDYASALSLFERAIEIGESALGSDHPQVATYLNNLGGLLEARGDYAAAEALFERAASILEESFGPEHPVVAQSLSNLAGLRRARGDHAGARQLFERAASIFEATLEENDPLIALGLNNLAGALYDAGDYERAKPLFERAVSIREHTFGPDHPDVATSLSNLAELLRTQGRYASAQPLFERTLAIQRRALGDDHPDVSISLSNLASLLRLRGDFTAARTYNEMAIRVYEKALGPDHPNFATSLSNLAGQLRAQGDYLEALPLCERALDIRLRAFGPDHPDVALSLCTLARLLDDAEARPLYERAVAIQETALGPDHPDLAMILSDLAELCRRQGTYAESALLFERAQAIYVETLGENHPSVATSLNNLATLHFARGDYASAQPLYEKTIALYEAALGPEHPDVALGLSNLAVLFQATRREAEAFALLERAARIYGSFAERVLPTLATAEQEAFIDLNLNTQIGLLLSMRQETGDPTELYAQIGGWKGLLLHELRRNLRSEFDRKIATPEPPIEAASLLEGTDPEPHADSRARLQRARERVAHAYRTKDPSLEAITREKEEFEREVAMAFPSKSDPWRDHGVKGLSAMLPSGSAFVDLFRYRHVESGVFVAWHYIAMVMASRSLPTFVELGPADPLDDLVRQWRISVLRGTMGPKSAASLFEALWTPIASALPSGTERVWVSPDGQLVRFPWSWLSTWNHEYRSHDYRSHEHPSEAVSSGREIDLTEDTTQPEQAKHTLQFAITGSARALLLQLAQEIYTPLDGGADTDDFSLLGERSHPEERQRVLLVGDVDFGKGEAWAPLPGTRSEVQALSELATMAGLTPTTLSGRAASAPAIAHALQDAEYAHLATHGFLFTEGSPSLSEPRSTEKTPFVWRGSPHATNAYETDTLRAAISRSPLVESGLVCAGANGPDEMPSGGRLTAEEIVSLDLSGLELVTLSACDSGRGAEVTGQGVLGLQTSFTAAGARTLLMSLWPVPDQSTATLMDSFYRGLWSEGRTPAAALQQAQEAVRQVPGWEPPLFWAAWVLSGTTF